MDLGFVWSRKVVIGLENRNQIFFLDIDCYVLEYLLFACLSLIWGLLFDSLNLFFFSIFNLINFGIKNKYYYFLDILTLESEKY